MPADVPPGPVSVEFDHVSFAYPSADKVSLASLEEVATLDTRGGVEVIHDVSFRVEPGQMVALVGSSGAGKSTMAQLLARLYDVDDGAIRLGGVDVRDLSFAAVRETLGHGDPGRSPVPRERPRQPAAGASERHRRRTVGGAAALPAGRSDRLAARRPGHRGGGARLPAVRRRAAAAHDRSAAARPAAGGDPGRGHRSPGLHLRGRRAGRAGRGAWRAGRRWSSRTGSPPSGRPT